METLASSVEDRVFKLLRNLVKLEPSEHSDPRYKEIYRIGLTAKMATSVQASNDLVDNGNGKHLLALHAMLVAIKRKFYEDHSGIRQKAKIRREL